MLYTVVTGSVFYFNSCTKYLERWRLQFELHEAHKRYLNLFTIEFEPNYKWNGGEQRLIVVIWLAVYFIAFIWVNKESKNHTKFCSFLKMKRNNFFFFVLCFCSQVYCKYTTVVKLYILLFVCWKTTKNLFLFLHAD